MKEFIEVQITGVSGYTEADSFDEVTLRLEVDPGGNHRGLGIMRIITDDGRELRALVDPEETDELRYAFDGLAERVHRCRVDSASSGWRTEGSPE